jgi:hypothetical protein
MIAKKWPKSNSCLSTFAFSFSVSGFKVAKEVKAKKQKFMGYVEAIKDNVQHEEGLPSLLK